MKDSPLVFRIGPGLALAVGACVLLLWPTLRDSIPGGRPRIERSQLAAIPAPPAAPELGWLLTQRDELQLAPGQVEKLRRLKTQWDRDTGPVRAALNGAAAQFNRDMAFPGGNRTSLPDLQERAGPLSELSGQLAKARRAYWSDASRVLTMTQRTRAEDAWTRQLGLRRIPPAH